MGLLEDSRIEVSLRAAPAGWSRLQFDMEQQEQTFWCWAATSVSVSHYYEDDSDWTQCRMVNAERKQTMCCKHGDAKACNVPNVLDSPLKRAHVLDRSKRGKLSFHDIQREIDAGRPLAWRIEWPDQTGHFAVIEGYQASGRQLVAVEDPWTGSVDVPLETLLGDRYRGDGRWTHSYFTQSPS